VGVRKKRHFLDKRTHVCYCFSEMNDKAKLARLIGATRPKLWRSTAGKDSELAPQGTGIAQNGLGYGYPLDRRRGAKRTDEANVVSKPSHASTQISLIPFSEACPSRPTIMWSCTATPNDLAIAMMSCVILTSWVEGVGSPEG
jgi:hypothetical protein